MGIEMPVKCLAKPLVPEAGADTGKVDIPFFWMILGEKPCQKPRVNASNFSDPMIPIRYFCTGNRRQNPNKA